MPVKRRNITRHHLIPRSRKKDLKKLLGLKYLDKEFIRETGETKNVKALVHDCWHLLFSNYFPWEAIEQIRLWATEDMSDFRVFLDLKRRMAWYIIFEGEVSPKAAIEAIKKDWWPRYILVGKAVKLGLL